MLDTQADRDGLVVVYPDAVEKSWNDGRTSVTRAARENIDDVDFLTKLIAHVKERVPIDATRIYSTGISNGAFMSNWLACQAPGLLRGMILVVGTGPDNMVSRCASAQPLTIVAMHGTADPPARRSLRDVSPTDGSTVNSRLWTTCAPGITTEFLRIDGGGHTWPGEPNPLPERIVGRTNYDISASELVARLIAA